MSHLSQALQKYYSREGKRILFRNGRSLNELAQIMWERLGFHQVDASVLSRVLKGERLLTAPQLRVLCASLAIPKQEEEYLLACLQQDRSAKLEVYANTIHLSSSLIQNVMEELTKSSFDTFYQGNYDALEKKYDVIQNLANSYTLNNGNNPAIGELLGLALYLKGRTIANGELPSRVIGKVYPVFTQLIALSKIHRSQRLYGYAYVLLSTTYYLAGGYSDSSKKHRFYRDSIRFAKKAIDCLPADDHESLFALRSIAASGTYIHDRDAILYVMERTKAILPKQPRENYINMLHLTMTLSKGLASAHVANPFAVQESASAHFKKSLANTGVYEISAIKEEIDTLLLLGTQEKAYVQRKLREGLSLSDDYHFSRQKKYFAKLLRSL